MSGITYERTSLDEKLRRLRYSSIPSKEYSLWLMHKVSEKSVLKTILGSDGGVLAKMLKDNFNRNFRKKADEVTIGDLAVLIAGWYLKEGESTKDVMIYMSALFYILDKNLGKADMYLGSGRLGSSRKGITMDVNEMNHLGEWLHVPMGDYIGIIMGLDMPPKSKEICAELFVSGRYSEMTGNWMLIKSIMERSTGDSGSEESTLSAKWIISKASLLYERTRYSSVIDPFINYIILPMAFLTAGEDR